MLRVTNFLRTRQRFRGRWANATQEMIDKNRKHMEKVRKQRQFEATAIPWKKYGFY